MSKRKRTVCEVKFRDKKTGELTDLHIPALLVQAGKYWWVRLFYQHNTSQWELTPVEKIREYSDGLLG